jgi:hypothetical protein
VHYGGRKLVATSEMAGIFVRRAQQLLDRHESGLVPLLHKDGIELLLVSDAIPFSVHDEDLMPSDGSHTGLTADAETIRAS